MFNSILDELNNVLSKKAFKSIATVRSILFMRKNILY